MLGFSGVMVFIKAPLLSWDQKKGGGDEEVKFCSAGGVADCFDRDTMLCRKPLEPLYQSLV